MSFMLCYTYCMLNRVTQISFKVLSNISFKEDVKFSTVIIQTKIHGVSCYFQLNYAINNDHPIMMRNAE
jgi:hypothetical protein